MLTLERYTYNLSKSQVNKSYYFNFNIYYLTIQTSGQDGGIGRHLAQPKEGQQQFKNKKQPELTENRTVWKSANRDKEETFIQSSRRGGDGQPGGEDSWQDGGWRTQRGSRLWSGVGKAAAVQRGSSRWTSNRLHNPRAPAPGNKASNH